MSSSKQRTNLAESNPILAREWHPSKNGKLTPPDVSPGSHKKVWWKCPKGEDHEWQASAKDRNGGRGCAICAGKIVVKSNSLSTLNPQLASEWHATKNGTLYPDDVTPKSNKKVWWKCPNGEDHEWQAKISDRNRGDGCGICANRIVVKSNCLATLNPGLVNEWHPRKNGSLTPCDVTPRSNRKVWWKCPKGDDHEWKTSIAHRSTGTGCPICSNKLVTESNCLATINPQLAREWHPSKNGSLTPFDVSPGSNRRVWWKCPKGEDHEWKATIIARTEGHGCAVCANRVVVKSNSLATLRPDLAKEWHPTKNGDLTPENCGKGSPRRVWWKCPRGDDHEWQASIVTRTNGVGCPVCSNKKIVTSNCLATLRPDLAKEWHPTRNGRLTPYDFGAGSAKKVWWKCPKGDDHQWEASILHRTNGQVCLVCANRRIVKSNCLATLRPDLAKEWHPTNNGNLTPNKIGLGSGKKVWWMCKKGHEWQASLDHRKRGVGCPLCRNASSAPELRIFCELKALFPSAQHRVLIEGYEVDILIPELGIGIEYDGEYWHRNKQKQDIKKNEVLKDRLLLIRIREKGLSLLNHTDIRLQSTDVSMDTIKRILHSILEHREIKPEDSREKIVSYFSNSDWIAPDYFDKLYSAREHIEFDESISFLFPDIASEWHPTKNGPLLPEFFSPGSNKKVWWKCPRGDDHEWQATVTNRVLGRGCPICSNRKVVRSNCLTATNPDLAEEWHPTRNGNLTPDDVACGSNRRVWWKCPNGDDHEWEAQIASRTAGVGCPICASKKVVKSNSLSILRPDLAKEWHPTRNGALSPQDITPGSHKKVWWKCSKGNDHVWSAQVKARSNGAGCPVCANRVVVRSNCLAVKYPKLAKEWHPHKNGKLSPYDVIAVSTQKVWWKGICGHEWQADIAHRSKRSQRCPVCWKNRSKLHGKKDVEALGQLGLFED